LFAMSLTLVRACANCVENSGGATCDEKGTGTVGIG